MDWPIEDADWTSHDLRNFEFQSRPTVVLQKTECNTSLKTRVLEDKNDWENWFDDATTTERENGLYIVLLSRAWPIFDEDAPVSYVSVTRDTWERLTRFFYIHRSITRSIARQIACFTSSYEEGKGSKLKICFTARMAKQLPQDLALSLTYSPGTDSTFAVVYGCNEKQMREIERRVRSIGAQTKYPLFMTGIFAELERERLVASVDKLVDGFALQSGRLESGSWNPSTDMSNAKAQMYLELCLDSRKLVDNIRAVKRQISKLLTEIDEFGSYFASLNDKAHPNASKKARQFKKAGIQMKKRLQDILNEYDDKIDECNMIVGNTTLAMQTVWNQIARHDSDLSTKIAHANTMIALETKREGIQMRSIALLTMVYLPFSSVAAVFSMDMFNWDAQDGDSVVSKYIWVFATFAIGFTAITLFAWHHITCRHERRADEDASEIQSKMV
ncbi:hypothetical protein F4776DRAFT_471974 [Hypoxylon sp. NC0597]|nr:hypothetical protein F4776DRAFT_471974 [Hypoxylon sp. NC0597]